jgi:hypothetical protein
MAAFGNAGRPVTDGAKCACLAFIDRHWCDHPVSSAGELVATIVAGQGAVVLFSPSCQNCFDIRDAVVRITEAPKRRM